MEKKKNLYFTYPPNLHELDLATLVSMYRERGMPKKARPGDYFACAVTHKMIKDGKWWFGRYYSQQAWDDMLTRGCGGYPLTEVELNVLGMALAGRDDLPKRAYLEQHCGAISKLAYMIVNDLKEFGFLSLDDQDRAMITPAGEKALQGIARRIHDRKFHPDMLQVQPGDIAEGPVMEQAPKIGNEQASLF